MRGTPKDHGKAEECLREAVTLQEDHTLSLFALACLLWHRSFYTQSEVLLNQIMELHVQEEFIAWVLLGQLQLSKGDHMKEANNCFARAESLFAICKFARAPVSEESIFGCLKHPFSLSQVVLHLPTPGNPYTAAALLLLDFHLPSEAQVVLENEHTAFPCHVDYDLCLGRFKELLGEYSEAEKIITEANGSGDIHAAGWMLLGHLYFRSSSDQKAINAYEKMLSCREEKPFFVLAYLELGKCYLETGQLEKARKTFLEVCTLHPSSSSWLGVGMAYYKEGNMVQAEVALLEGNILDPWNFKIWAYLTLICIRTDRMEQAEFALNQALQLHPFLLLLVQIAECFYEKGNFRAADSALQKVCEEKGSSLDTSFFWRSCSWQEKVSLAKKVIARSTVTEEFLLELDPLKAFFHTSNLQPVTLIEALSDAELMELEVISSIQP